MSIVSDLMAYLNKTFGLSLPVLPLAAYAKSLTALWKSTVTGWKEGETPPAQVKVSLPEPVDFPIAGGNIKISEATININLPKQDDGTGT